MQAYRFLIATLLAVFSLFATAAPVRAQLIHEDFFLITLDGGGPRTSAGNWGGASPGSASFRSLVGEPGRPGILRMHTSNSTGSVLRLFKAPQGWESGLYPNAFGYDDLSYFEWQARLSANADVNITLSLTDQINLSLGDNVAFNFDTNVSPNLRCLSAIGGLVEETQVVMPSAGVFHTFRVELSPGQIDFLVDGVVVASHITRIPAGKYLTPYVVIISRANVHRDLDLDDFLLE